MTKMSVSIQSYQIESVALEFAAGNPHTFSYHGRGSEGTISCLGALCIFRTHPVRSDCRTFLDLQICWSLQGSKSVVHRLRCFALLCSALRCFATSVLLFAASLCGAYLCFVLCSALLWLALLSFGFRCFALPSYHFAQSASVWFGVCCFACFALLCCAVICGSLLSSEDSPGRFLENRPGYVGNPVSLRSLVSLRSVVDHLIIKRR